MLSFTKFIIEKSNLDVAIRAARIHGSKNINRSGLRASKGEYIPLSKRGHPSSVGAAVAKYEKHSHNIVDKHTTFKIKDLHATQPFVKVGDHDKLKSKIEGGLKNAHVITHNGKHYVADGHHEIMGARLRGDREVTVRHTNLDTV